MAAGSTARARGGRLAWLDALRGLAALCVVLDHLSYFTLTAARGRVDRWFDLGQYGVFVFFLVSGYIIPASLERKGSIGGFWVSRGFRLYPVYLLAIAASVAGYAVGLGTIRGGQRHPLESAASWLLMLSNVLSGPNVPTVVWTLAYEMVFYLLLAALFSVRAHRLSGSYAVGCGLVVATVGAWLPTAALDGYSGPLPPGGIDLAADALIAAGIGLAVSGRWVAGGSWLAAATGLLLVTVNQDHYPTPWGGYTILAFMFTGTLVYRAEQGQVSRARAAAIALLVLALTVGGGMRAAGQHPGWFTGDGLARWRWQWATSLAGAAVTFGIGLAARHRRVPPALAWLGMISYSVYLLHPLVLNACAAIGGFRSVRTVAGQGVLAVVVVAVILALSAVTYYLVERPAQRLGRRLARRWD